MSIKLFHKYPTKINEEVGFKWDEELQQYKEDYAKFIRYWGPLAMCEPAEIIVAIVLTIVSAVMTYAMMPSMNMDLGLPSEDRTGNEINTRSTQEPLNIVYGTVEIAGNDVFGTTGGNQNNDLYIVQTLCEGPIEGIYQEASVDQLFVEDKIYTEFGTDASYTVYTGTSGQTYDTDINTFDSTWTDNLRYTAYIAWHFIWNEDKFRRVPDRRAIVKGLHVYDFRTSTTAWSDNAVLCLYDYVTNSRYGAGLDSSLIDITSWTVAANYVDTKGWSFNRCIKGNEMGPWEVMKMIMRHFHGSMQWFNGKYYLYVADLNEESSVMTIEDRHIVQDGTGKALVTVKQPSRFNKPNGLRITYNDKDLNYVKNDVIFGEQDGLVSEMKLLGCTNRAELGDHGNYFLERMQLNRTIDGVFSDECLELEPHDIVTFNSTSLGISDQTMRVSSVNIQTNGLIALSLVYESEDLYNTTYDLNVDDIYNNNFPDPNEPVYISNPSIEEETYYYLLKTFSRINIDFSVAEEQVWYDHCDVYEYITSGGPSPSASQYSYKGPQKTNFTIDPVEKDKIYYYILRPVNKFGARNAFTNSVYLSQYIYGKSAAPTSLTYLAAIATSSGVSLYSDEITEPDVERYEFRLGSNWSGGLLLSSKIKPQEALVNVKPGLHSFTANTKGTNGLYGNDPVAASVSVPLDSSYSLSHIYTDDYAVSAGTFYNTEVTTYASENYLKCSHSSSLSGSYFSNTYDTGSIQNYYVYLDADPAVQGEGTSWNSLSPSGTAPSAATWNDVGPSTASWNDLSKVIEAGQINIFIQYKEGVGDNWSNLRKAEILGGKVSARYFRVKIVIIDPVGTTNSILENFRLKIYT